MTEKADESFLKIDWWTARKALQKEITEGKKVKKEDKDYSKKWKTIPLGEDLLR